MSKKILLADDEQFITIAYRDGLQRAGFIVVVARDGDETLILAKKEMPDVILLDLIMPKLNGFEVLKDLKKDAKLAKIPVVILSNLGQDSDEKEALKLGATDFYVKSDLSLEDLIKNIHTLLG